MSKLTDQQREKLMTYIKQVYDLEQKIWGLLPPSSDRDSARIRLFNARLSLENIIIKESIEEEA